MRRMKNDMNKSRGRKKLNWRQKIMRDLERVERLLPEENFMQGDWPEWVRQMFAEVLKATVPRANWCSPEEPTAGEVGRFVGVKAASMGELEGFELSEKQEAVLERLLEKQWDKKMQRKFLRYVKTWVEKFYPAYKGALSRAILLASKQPLQEQAEFFKSYAQMVGMRPDMRADTTTRIYYLMVVNWREFERLRESGKYSTRQLHEWLCRIFGSHLVGDLKKTEKMCQRKGLSFRRPGRPSLTENSDIKPA